MRSSVTLEDRSRLGNALQAALHRRDREAFDAISQQCRDVGMGDYPERILDLFPLQAERLGLASS